MHRYEETMRVLEDRRQSLRHRIGIVEKSACSRGFSSEKADASLTFNPILDRFLAETRAEVAKADAAIRRINRREFDCCIMCGGDIDSDELAVHPYSVNCNECAKRFPVSYADDVCIQHSDLNRMWKALQDAMASASAQIERQLPAEVEICACLAIADCMCIELREHFETEENDEAGGYMRAALRAAPYLERRAGHLREQHDEFTRRISKIREALHDAAPELLPWSELQANMQALVKELLAHDEAENEILSEAFLDDLGGEG